MSLINLPVDPNKKLNQAEKKTGISKSKLLIQAVDEFLNKFEKKKLDAFGLWKGRDINLRALRDEWDRY